MAEAVIALGANLGNPAETLKVAADELAQTPGVTVRAVSRLYTTSPVESSGPDYVNAVVRIDTTLTPLNLLKVCQAIENEHGRVRPQGVINAPRTLDLDVISYEGVTQHDPVLTLPHPRMHERLFVLVPLADVWPDYVLSSGEIVSSAIERVGNTHPDQQIRLLAGESMA